MQSVSRSWGKLVGKGPGDNAKVSLMLNDFEDADKVLVKLIDSAKSWREAWISLVTSQLGIATEYEGLYDPIVGATDGHGKEMTPTPESQLQRTLRLCEVYRELKDELMEEIGQIEPRVIKPATDARDCIQPIRKTIKKRENKRLDYEKQQDKVNKLARKSGKTPKEENQLAKAQEDMNNMAEEFHIADGHLRETLPHIVNAAFSMVPPLLGCHVLIQNKLLGLYYTFLNGYCEEVGFPSPPPPMEQVVADWTADFKPVQAEMEQIGCVSRGKAIHMSMRLPAEQPEQPGARRVVAPPQPDALRRTSTGLIPGNDPKGRLQRMSSAPAPAPPSQPTPRPGLGGAHLRATDFTTATALGEPSSAPLVVRPRTQGPLDYFGHDRPQHSPASTPGGHGHPQPHRQPSSSSISAASIAAKKKPPPPPPPKPRIPAAKPPDEFVVAMFAFPGQGKGDLSFQAGDRIRIIKKTQTADDWWEGEVGGRKGSFPANYCQPA
ncbi:SH3 domain signaling protein [Pyricularia oryzae 70-15]|uniref:SH3 domain signaling protein n=1 Tax=Pyricularia oryzae (strain 70-15 / ATCC MYA-4617 / FGSC 8958) TaxID=242507 RepID=G4NLP0_PYRO7|nr:SH3 domain signaling protein [Pyricularia oryzae 70-15]EHA46093.1 SH3 domain signaling protein [Pyricularia oryzae 70-15]